MKYLVILFLTSVLVACSSTSDQPKTESMQTPLPIVTPGPINISELISALEPQLATQNLWLKVIDNKNGYARLEGPFEGYYEYFLFKGESKDLFVKAKWGCGPACQQLVYFYEVQNKKFKKISFSQLIHPKHISKFKNAFETCQNEDISFGGYNLSSCGTMIIFSRIGTGLQIYGAHYFEDEKYSFKDGRDGQLLSQFKWNKKRFVFE